ncbi:helix-turn-helix transcriptional regulator [Microvirgula sp. AG722]|uniref:helix-turn-helix domain-containing protein n=1 Tax=Microvirgula sp. AG722 TaxID=2183901 RepID=UPI000DDAFF32
MALAIKRKSDRIASMDWKQLIKDLVGRGLTQNEIGRAADVSQPYISDLLNGRRRQPSWEIGDKLLRLSRRTTKRLAHRQRQVA